MQRIKGLFSAASSSMTSGLVANLFLSVLLGFSLKQMWKLLGTLQIITHITLLNIPLASNFQVCLESIVNISNLSIIPQSFIDSTVNFFNDSSLAIG